MIVESLFMSDIMGPNGSFVIYNTKESTDTYELGNQKESSSKGRDFKEERDFGIPDSDHRD